jgi:polysaccharide biosynthesis/export protein VpsN
MNLRLFGLVQRSLLCLLAVFALFLAGCATDNEEIIDPKHVDVSHLHVGDTVTVVLSGLPDSTQIAPHEEAIKEDGTITLQEVGAIQAVGKTVGELQRDIQNAYVPNLYRHITVTVTTTSERVYYGQGQVTRPGEQLYRENMTVTRAIAAAGDFTDFANRKKVVLTRANGQRIKVNCEDILDNGAPDPVVYPGDQIHVYPRNF